MFKYRFTPTDAFAKIIHKLTKEQSNYFAIMFDSIIFKIFSPTAKSHNVFHVEGSDDILVEIMGVVPFPDEITTHKYDQIIVSELASRGLDKLFRLSAFEAEPLAYDVLMVPTVLDNKNIQLKRLFNIEDKEIPANFICYITHEIMGDPAYLTSNPKVNYEYSALLRWVAEKKSDPLTREQISALHMVRNTALERNISTFFIDRLFNNDLTKYFHPTRDVGTDTNDLDSKESNNKSSNAGTSLLELDAKKINATSTISAGGIFASSSNSTIGTDAKAEDVISATKLVTTFISSGLEAEFLNLAAKSLRRAAHNGDCEKIRTLLNSGMSKIVDFKDSVETSLKTALHHAVKQGKTDVCKLLLENKADINIKDANNITPRDLMLNSKITEIQNMAKPLEQPLTTQVVSDHSQRIKNTGV